MKTCRVLVAGLAVVLVMYGVGGFGAAGLRAHAQVPEEEPSYAEVCGAYAALTYLVGDLNGDGHVDVVDLLILGDTWTKSLGDPGFNPEADFDCSGTVDVVDLLTFAENWGI